jgi:hypothetical protein
MVLGFAFLGPGHFLLSYATYTAPRRGGGRRPDSASHRFFYQCILSQVMHSKRCWCEGPDRYPIDQLMMGPSRAQLGPASPPVDEWIMRALASLAALSQMARDYRRT